MRSGFKFSQLPDPNTFLTEPGSPIRTIFAPVIENGCLSLAENGKQNIQTLIDSYRDTTDMTYIMARLTAGDTTVLNARDAFYADVSNCSFNPAEMLQNIIDARTYFDALPKDIREKFGYDFKAWFSDAGSKDWAERMTGIKKVEEAKVTVSEPAVVTEKVEKLETK